MSGFWLFSYGSNHTAQLADRIGRQVTDGQRAVLKGYQRVFRGWSVRWDGGVASLEPKRGATTYGWAAKLTAAELAKLDVYEGVASGHYARSVVKIDLPDLGKKNVTAIAYVSRDPEHHAPSEAYLEACARTVGEWWSEAGRPVTAKDFPVRNNPPGCRIVSLTTEEPELRQDARSLFAKIDIRYDDSEDLYEACVSPDGSVLGASTLGLYDQDPDDADDLRRPRWRFSVVVDEKARRQGIAKALVESIARAHPREKVLLEGKVVNPHMATLLKGLGFYYYEQPEDEIEWGEHERSWGHRMYRPNPDDRLRQLERAFAASGAPGDKLALAVARWRAGLAVAPDEASGEGGYDLPEWREWGPLRVQLRWVFPPLVVEVAAEEWGAGHGQRWRVYVVSDRAEGRAPWAPASAPVGAHRREQTLYLDTPTRARAQNASLNVEELARHHQVQEVVRSFLLAAQNPRPAKRNPSHDDRLRQLERAKAAGDPQAGYALHAERLRAGLPLVPDETLDHVPMWPTAFVRFDRYYFTPEVGVQVAWRGPGVLQGGPWHDPNSGTESVTFAVIEHDLRRGWNETESQWTKHVSEVQAGLVDAYTNLWAASWAGAGAHGKNPPARDDRRYRFVTSCIDSTSEDIHALQASAKEIARPTFVRKLAPGEWHEIQKRLGFDTYFPITKDRYVDYFRGMYRGTPAVFLTWSAIEYVFTLDGQQGPSAGVQRDLVDMRARSGERGWRTLMNPDADLRKLERAAAQGDRDALLALHTARQRAGVAETGEQALEYLLASGAAVRVFSNEFGNTQQLLARIGCGYLGDGAASPDRMWWSRGHPDVERQLPGAWAYHYRDWVVVLDEDASPEIRARLARLPSPASALANMVASFPGRLPSAARALERARDLARLIRLRLAADRSAASRARAEMTPEEEAEFTAEWRRYVVEENPRCRKAATRARFEPNPQEGP